MGVNGSTEPLADGDHVRQIPGAFDPPAFLRTGEVGAWTHAQELLETGSQEEKLAAIAAMRRMVGNHHPRSNGDAPSGPLLLRWDEYKEMAQTSPPADFVVPKLYRRGQSSLLVGEPKAGKSTLSRRIAVAVARGDRVLGYQVDQAPAIVLALQEDPRHVVREIEKIHPNPGIHLFLHNPGQPMEWERLRNAVTLIGRCALVVVDMVADFKVWEDGNDYVEMKGVIGRFTGLARETGVHVLLVHHGNKTPATSYPTARVHGSAAIAGEVDVVASVHRDPKKGRVFQAEGRGIAFFERRLGA